MAGFEFVGNCFATSDQAMDAYYSQIQPFSYETSTSIYTLKHELVSGDWHRQATLTDLNTGATTLVFSQLDDVISFRSCDTPNDPYSQFMDGMELGWGVATVMILTFLIWRLKRI